MLWWCDYGADRGEHAGLGRGVLAHARAAATLHDWLAATVTDDVIVLVPVKRVGLLRRFVPRRGPPVEVLHRADVILEIGATERAFGARITPVRFVRRDGSARLVEFRADPSPWRALAR
jgi:hypothetical protein